MAKLNVIASPVVTDDSILSEDDLCPNIVHIEGIAELPNIEVFFICLMFYTYLPGELVKRPCV